MPRKPIAEKPMTSAERVRRHREKLRESTEPSLKKCLSENKRLQKRIAVLKAEKIKLKEEVDFGNMFMNMHSLFNDNESKTQRQFSIDDIKLIRQLCHPDKHNQSKASNNASILLNKMFANMAN
jgi:hypothetical protein